MTPKTGRCAELTRVPPIAARASRMIGAMLIAVVAIGSPLPSAAQRLEPRFWATDGPVRATVLVDSTLYIGGEFGVVGPVTGGGAALSRASGRARPESPTIGGTVEAVASDGSGGWYIAGSFSSVGGVARSGLAHLRADLSISPWDPAHDPTATIKALAVGDGVVYVGGTFSTIGGQPRRCLAARDTTTGLAT